VDKEKNRGGRLGQAGERKGTYGKGTQGDRIKRKRACEVGKYEKKKLLKKCTINPRATELSQSKGKSRKRLNNRANKRTKLGKEVQGQTIGVMRSEGLDGLGENVQTRKKLEGDRI